MHELNPLMQVRFNGTAPVLDLLVDNKSYIISDDRILRALPTLAEISPATIDSMKNSLIAKGLVNKGEASGLVEALLEMRIIVSSIQVHSTKAGIQYWVDHGWVDALTLHLNSRNIQYVDDPVELGGYENIDVAPFITNKDESDTDNYRKIYLNKPSRKIEAEEILKGILHRRSFKAYSRKCISKDEIGDILWHANQYACHTESLLEKGSSDRKLVFDSAFSALKTYVVIYPQKDKSEITDNVLTPGVYCYNKKKHSLSLLREGNFSDTISRIAIGQKRAGKGLLTLVITGDWKLYRERYPHSRSYRNLLINVAELAQFYLILLTILEFNTFMTPAIQDEICSDFLGTVNDLPLYIVGAG